mgnify:CR=1 FL=1
MNYNINNLNNFNYNINDDVSLNELSLNDLKNILYSNKNLSDHDKIKIKKTINKKINFTNKINIINKKETEFETETETKSIESNDILIENDDINKLFDRVDKKGQNQRFTQSSKKLLDRMFSEASYINNYQVINNTNVMSKPYVDDNNNNKKLGIRKNIKK